MDNNLQIFKNDEFGKIRGKEIDNKPYVVLRDVCKVLGLNNVSQVKTRLNKDGVITNEVIDSLGRRQKASFIDESNLYKVIFQSRKPEAEKFTDWVTSEVLPSIRKTGSYLAKTNNSLQAIKLVNEQVGALLGTVEQIDERVDYLEDNMTVDFGQQRRLQNKAKSKALESLGGIESHAYKDKSIRSKVFSGIWRDYKDYFMIGSYRDTLKKEFDKGIEFLDNWQPQGKLLREIEEMNKQLNLEKVM